MLHDLPCAIRAFAAREAVLVVAVACALASCIAVPPDADYGAYVDWRTLALLFCLMVVVAGLRGIGVLDRVAALLLEHVRTQRGAAGALVGLAFFASMAVTNDVALITFVPIALAVVRRSGMDGRLCLVAALMTIAANLGSMLTPVGNPQNLFLFTASGMGAGEFLLLTSPYVAASGIMLALVCGFGFSGERVGEAAVAGYGPRCAEEDGGEIPEDGSHCAAGGVSPDDAPTGPRSELGAGDSSVCHLRRIALYSMLFAACLLSVAGVLDVFVLLALVLVGVLASDRTLLRRVDWGLLATFVALFVFVGNMGRIPVLHDALSVAVQENALLAAVGASQVISNVPAAVLLSGFSDQWGALVLGTDIGGLGTPIASMASLITLKMVSVGRAGLRRRYLVAFTAWNMAFLAALLGLHALTGIGCGFLR